LTQIELSYYYLLNEAEGNRCGGKIRGLSSPPATKSQNFLPPSMSVAYTAQGVWLSKEEKVAGAGVPIVSTDNFSIGDGRGESIAAAKVPNSFLVSKLSDE
jgi:hypothetical protein